MIDIIRRLLGSAKPRPVPDDLDELVGRIEQPVREWFIEQCGRPIDEYVPAVRTAARGSGQRSGDWPDPRGTLLACAALSEVACRRYRESEATRVLLQTTVRLAEEGQRPDLAVRWRLLLARQAVDLLCFADAARILSAATALAEQEGLTPLKAEALLLFTAACVAEAEFLGPDEPESGERLAQAAEWIALARQVPDPAWQAKVSLVEVDALRVRGEDGSALEHLRDVQRQFGDADPERARRPDGRWVNVAPLAIWQRARWRQVTDYDLMIRALEGRGGIHLRQGTQQDSPQELLAAREDFNDTVALIHDSGNSTREPWLALGRGQALLRASYHAALDLRVDGCEEGIEPIGPETALAALEFAVARFRGRRRLLPLSAARRAVAEKEAEARQSFAAAMVRCGRPRPGDVPGPPPRLLDPHLRRDTLEVLRQMELSRMRTLRELIALAQGDDGARRALLARARRGAADVFVAARVLFASATPEREQAAAQALSRAARAHQRELDASLRELQAGQVPEAAAEEGLPHDRLLRPLRGIASEAGHGVVLYSLWCEGARLYSLVQRAEWDAPECRDDIVLHPRFGYALPEIIEALTSGHGPFGASWPGHVELERPPLEWWRILSPLLLHHLKQHLRSEDLILFVPHGVFHRVPIAGVVLRDRSEGPAGWEYLVERHPVLVLPSLALASDGPTRRPAARAARIMGRPPVFPETACAEVEGLERRLGATAMTGWRMCCTGESAPEQRWPGAGLLHLSTHGYAPFGAPAYSGLLFADGYLTALEIALCDLHAVRLAVLGACETGRRASRPGEESLSPAVAFLLAGAEGVVATTATIYDADAAWLLERFYAEARPAPGAWPGPIQAALALCAAQRQLLDAARSRSRPDRGARLPPAHPGSWAILQVLAGRPRGGQTP